MKYIKLYEGWFSKKKENIPAQDDETEVQKEIKSPIVTEDKVPSLINDYLESKKGIILYRKLFQSEFDNNPRSNKYYNKFISFIENSCRIFYNLSKVKDLVKGFDLEKEFKFLSNIYINRRIKVINDNTNEIHKMGRVTFYLNEIYTNLYGGDYQEDQIFYFQEDGGVLKFRNREEQLKQREVHKDVDPYGEEEWQS